MSVKIAAIFLVAVNSFKITVIENFEQNIVHYIEDKMSIMKLF